MEFKTINRDWVKNAAIIFLAVLLVLTFFSNTIMNRSLPEVATQMVTNGAITAKVRGTGTVTANGLHEVKATETRVIRSVMVKSGQEVIAGDVLFVLGEGDSAELEAAQDQLRQLQSSYNSTAIGVPGGKDAEIAAVEKLLGNEKDPEDGTAWKEYNEKDAIYKANIDATLTAAEERLSAAVTTRNEISKKYNEVIDARKLYDYPDMALTETVTDAGGNNQTNVLIDEGNLSEALKSAVQERDRKFIELKEAQAADPLDDAIVTAKRTDYDDAVSKVKKQAEADISLAPTATDLTNAQAEVDTREAEVMSLRTGNIYAQERQSALEKIQALKDKIAALQSENAAIKQSQAQAGVTLTDLAVQINKQREKIKQLSGESADQIVANVAGTVESVSCTAGDTKAKDDVLCTIEVPDMGYTLSFSVTTDQARRLRTGNTATVSNYYWGQEILATLTSIKTDPKNPQSNKLLTFDLTGDVTAGAELTLSVGERSANYDIIIPNSAIRSDTNGSFVLAVQAKNSPLGNRYIAQRVAIEVIAADDSNSAVTAALEYGDYVITTSNAPLKSGDQVRMADT